MGLRFFQREMWYMIGLQMKEVKISIWQYDINLDFILNELHSCFRESNTI